jgi:hypothetical protein
MYHLSSWPWMRRALPNTAIASSTSEVVTTSSQEATFDRRTKVPARPFAWSSSWSVGTKAAVMDPSARSRRKRFGRIHAVLNAE